MLSLDSSAMQQLPHCAGRDPDQYFCRFISSGDARTIVRRYALMHPNQDTRAESAIYWSAVSLIVCEGLSVGAAAERLGIENVRLRNILRRRRRRFADVSGVTNPRHSSLP
jgi:hypothetical protein